MAENRCSDTLTSALYDVLDTLGMAENRCSDTLSRCSRLLPNGSWGWPKTAALIHFCDDGTTQYDGSGMAENRCSDTLEIGGSLSG